MNRGLRAVVLTIAVLCLAAPAVEAGGQNEGSDNDGGGTFSVRDVQGPTAFNFDGFATVLVGGTATTAPVASIGRFFADGRGHLTNGVRTLVVGGTAIDQRFKCDYSVNPNGTGEAKCTVMTAGAPNTEETFDFVIVERKQSAFFTGTTPGVTIRGATKLQQ